MRLVDEAIHDRIAEGGVADASVPVFDRDLTGQQRGPTARPVFDQFQEITAFAVADRREAPVVQDQEIRLAELREDFAVRAVAARDRELGQSRGKRRYRTT